MPGSGQTNPTPALNADVRLTHLVQIPTATSRQTANYLTTLQLSVTAQFDQFSFLETQEPATTEQEPARLTHRTR